MTETEKMHYFLGGRDVYAVLLAELQADGIKAKRLAEQYKEAYKEEHFSHKFHTV